MLILQRLKRHFTASLDRVFAQFKLGAMVFFLGMVLVYMAYQLLADSLARELAMAGGLLVAAVGFAVAMAAHVRLVVSRLWRFFINR